MAGCSLVLYIVRILLNLIDGLYLTFLLQWSIGVMLVVVSLLRTFVNWLRSAVDRSGASLSLGD